MSDLGGPTVELRVWGVDRVLPALGRMSTGRRTLRATPGLRFAKLLGTGTAQTFTLESADLRHWAALTVWHDDAAALAADRSRLFRGWQDSSTEELRVTMRPLRSKGRWSRVEPFGSPPPHAAELGRKWAGPVAALTRARLRPTTMMSFWRAVPPVASELADARGNRLALGVGELPIGVQGTFSVWDSARDLTDFAYRSPAHVSAVRRTAPARWYAEELFARFAVTDVAGTYDGKPA
ncbi:monooxygenase [Gordonia sp. zg691]|uniref:Monooxygenase n=1 Tax=Gordonia jinghuaiqii TaxID=2758710 RepID=A0A7D7QGF2_9ACTN|nr:monooxygenase [Gordonia jinghuaiqii]MBD0860573.1 monooxygenase [Gordonia jinghuaiqii]MCR5978162.1 monooxygenase [Gordonia jinghuaiqii]QMT01382.1 monooxygenase [Gordonia jinghuaiqii]